LIDFARQAVWFGGGRCESHLPGDPAGRVRLDRHRGVGDPACEGVRIGLTQRAIPSGEGVGTGFTQRAIPSAEGA